MELTAKFDLHVHSNSSLDSNLESDEIVRLAEIRGLRGVAITDHNEVFDCDGRAGGRILVIPGIEVRTKSYEIIGLFVTERITGSDPLEVIDRIHSCSGVSVLPHPYSLLRTPRGGDATLQELASKVDAIEVFNSRNLAISQNKKANALADRSHRSKVAGSDAHTPGEIGRAFTLMRDVENIDDVRTRIIKGDTWCEGSLSPLTVHLATLLTKIRNMRKRPG